MTFLQQKQNKQTKNQGGIHIHKYMLVNMYVLSFI